jgi:Carbohydrate binding domain
VLIRPVISGYYAARPSEEPVFSTLTASKLTNEDANYHYLLGLLYQKHSDGNHLKEAIAEYVGSLQRDPSRSFAWLALSKAYESYGNQQWAEYAVKKAVFVDRANPKVIWETGAFYLNEGKPQEAAIHFRHYLALVPSEQDDVCAMFLAAGAKPAFMLTQLLPAEYQFYNRYFKFLMTYKQNQALSEVWGKRNLWNPTNAEYLSYCDFLIESGRLAEAQDVWTEAVQHLCPSGIAQDSSNMLFNGDFEYTPQNGGFDWKTGSADGVRIFVDRDVRKSGRSSLAATFNGKTNPEIYIAQQTIVVEPKQHYRLSGQIRTDKLTTHNGVLLEVLGQGCSFPTVSSEVVTGTNDWRPLEIEFTPPANCSLVKIGIKREQSQKFDNKISGTVWLDKFEMTQFKN